MVLLHWPCNIAEANSRLNRFPIRRNPWISRESSYWLAADLWPGWLPTSGPAGLAGPGCRPLARPGWLALESQNPPCRPDKVDSVISDYSVCRRLGGKALAGQCGQKTVEVIYKKAEVLWL